MSRKQAKNKETFLSEQELSKLILRFDRVYLNASLSDEELANLLSTEDYKTLSRQEAKRFIRGMRASSTPEGMQDLLIAGCLQTVLREATNLVASRCSQLRQEDSWHYWFESPFTRNVQDDVRKLFEKTIPFDLDAFGEIYVYSNDHLRFLFQLAARGELDAKIAGLLTMHEVKVDPLIWKRRREVSATE